MTLFVPFDGSELSKMALVRAAQFETVLEEGVLAVSVIPKNNRRYAGERGWLDDDGTFDAEAVVSHLRSTVANIAPAADFRAEFVDHGAPVGTIANNLRRVARNNDTSIVFLGSENAGRIVSAFTVGSSVTSDRAYDTMIVNSLRPTPVKKLENADPSLDRIS